MAKATAELASMSHVLRVIYWLPLYLGPILCTAEQLRPYGSVSNVLTPAEAIDALAEAARLRRLAWPLVAGQLGRLPLVWWGLAWMVGYPAAQFLPLAPALILNAVAVAVAFTLTRVGRRWDPIGGSTGWERLVSRAWWATAGASLLVNLVVTPAPVAVFFLVPGVLWGLALLLFALAAGDRALGVLGAALALLAPALRQLAPDQALLLFGVLGGGAMVAVGAVRTLSSAGWR